MVSQNANTFETNRYVWVFFLGFLFVCLIFLFVWGFGFGVFCFALENSRAAKSVCIKKQKPQNYHKKNQQKNQQTHM